MVVLQKPSFFQQGISKDPDLQAGSSGNNQNFDKFCETIKFLTKARLFFVSVFKRPLHQGTSPKSPKPRISPMLQKSPTWRVGVENGNAMTMKDENAMT